MSYRAKKQVVRVSEAPANRLLLRLTPISVPGQYGRSFRADRVEKRTKSNATFTIGDNTSAAVISTSSSKPSTSVEGSSTSIALQDVLAADPHSIYFIKCPDEHATDADKEDFKKEFESAESIILAAKNLRATSSNELHYSAEVDAPVVQFDIPRLLYWGDLQVGTETSPCLVYEHAEQVMNNEDALIEHTNPKKEMLQSHAYSVRKRGPDKTEMSNAVLRFARRFARAIQVVHNQGVVHSYLVPRNILSSHQRGRSFDFSGDFSIVGFGYARLCDVQGKQLRKIKIAAEDKCFRAPETRKRDTSKAFWFPADIFSIGALLYYLLLRSGGDRHKRAIASLKQLPIDPRRLRDYVARELKRALPSIVLENENILKIIDNCLRYDQEQRYSCVEELLDAIELAENAGTPQKETKLELRAVRRTEPGKPKVNVQLWWRPDLPSPRHIAVFHNQIGTELLQRLRSIQHGHLEIYGSRDRIVHSLCALLSSAKRGDSYHTVTLPNYWTDENLGSSGRFLTMNKHMVRQGVNIQRIFLISDSIESFHQLPESEQVVLEAQLRAQKEIAEEQERWKIDPESYGEFEIFVKPVPENKIAEFETVGETVAYLKEDSTTKDKPSPAVCLNFFSTATARRSKGEVLVNRIIKKVRYWWPIGSDRSTRLKENEEAFKKLKTDATSLKTFAWGEDPIDPNTIKIDDILDLARIVVR